MAGDAALMDKLTALCKRRGFIYQSSEIYGGIGGFWDYGPLGVELKRNIKDAWWRDMVTNPPNGATGHEISMVGLDCAIIMNPKVWEASGHASGFQDPMVSCRAEGCRALFRADQVFQVLLRRGAGDEPFAQCSVEAASEEEAVNAATAKATKLSKKHGGGTFLATAAPYLAAWDNGLAELKCPRCDTAGSLTPPRQFNLMFETFVGALQDASAKAYLRPETAQGIFVNYQNVLDTSRVKVPFGIAQIGKSFRNEINPRNYTFRSREFEQMEIEFFCHDQDAMAWYEFWRTVRYDWYVKLGLHSAKLRLRDQTEEELAHYSKACADIEYLFPFSDEFQELEGVAHRGCFDLSQHQKFSGKDLSYFDDEAWERDKANFPAEQHKEVKNKPPYRFLPTVIEPSAGADRATLAFLCEAYTEDQAPDEKGQMQQRVVMKFHPRLAPIKVAVFPLVNKEGMPDIAEQIYRDAKQSMTAFFDVKGAIGRRYRRQDEIGTPFCVTVDGQTLQDGTVTIRDRDTLEQFRVSKEHVVAWLRDKLAAQ
jgi:glycyl-tRNA synthetase